MKCSQAFWLQYLVMEPIVGLAVSRILRGEMLQWPPTGMTSLCSGMYFPKGSCDNFWSYWSWLWSCNPHLVWTTVTPVCLKKRGMDGPCRRYSWDMITVSCLLLPEAKDTAHLSSKGSIYSIMNPEILSLTLSQEGSTSGSFKCATGEVWAIFALSCEE